MAKMLTIEIGYSTTKAVLMDYKTKKPRVYRCAEFPTPQGAISDGYIVKEKLGELEESIKKGLKKGKLKAKRVVFSVYSGKIITREVMLPAVKEHQINAIIQSNITEYFPVELDDYKIANIKITTFRDGDNAGKHKVLVIAVENKLIKGYEELADNLKLKLVDIDYAGNSVFQSIRSSAGAEAIMAVKIEDENTLVTIAKQSTLVLQRNVNYNLGTQIEEDRVGINEAAHTIVGTVQRVCDFYESSENGGKISKIFVMGEGAKSEVLLKAMREQTELECIPIDLIRGVSLKKQPKKSPLGVFATVIGAGINSVGLDNDRVKASHETNYAAASMLMVVLIVLLAAVLLYQSIVPYNIALMEQRSLEKKQEELEPAKVVYDEYNSAVDMSARVEYGVALTQNSNDAILDFLAELEKKLPTDVEMTDFYSDDSEVIMTMKVADKETAAGVIKTIREFESLESVVVNSITEEIDEDATEDTNKSINFTLTGEYYVHDYYDPANNVATTDSGSDTNSDN